MSHVQPPDQQDCLANILSPEAKEFIPRQMPDIGATSYGDGLLGASPADLMLTDKSMAQASPVNGLPSYMTTCYPFVTSGEPRFGAVRPRFRGKHTQNHQHGMFMAQRFQSMQPGVHQSRFPHPSKGPVPASLWSPGAMGDMLSFGSLPNGMPFDGGTYQNGYIHTSQITSQDTKEVSNDRANDDDDDENRPLVNGYLSLSKQSWKTKHKRDHRNQDSDLTTKICYRSSCVQTDFPDCVANATLEEIPNTLFNDRHKSSGGKRSRHVSNHSASDVENYDYFHGQNTVSNGTSPSNKLTRCGDVAMTTMDNGIGHVINFERSSSAYSVSSGEYLDMRTGIMGDLDSRMNSMHTVRFDSVNSVPYNVMENNAISPTRRSYASIAQSLPSHNNKQTLVATTTSKSDHVNCDNSVTINRTSSSKKNSKGNNRSMSRLGNVNVNVAEIMQDLERADNRLVDAKIKHETTTTLAAGTCKVLYSSALQSKADNNKLNESFSKSSSNITMKKGHTDKNLEVRGQQVKGNVSDGQYSRSQQVRSQGQTQVKGHQGHSDNNKSDLDLDNKGHSQSDNNNQGEEGDVKKKKRRRRRRKKKSGTVTADDDEGEDNTGVREEITLHFEDEEEFPDLSAGLGSNDTLKSSLFNSSTVSYSQVLTNNNSVQSNKSSQEEQCSPDTTGASMVKESRTSRKRRKRRDVANKAAEAEMAEINLEQHMLELKMKQKLPLAAKKSVSPVRNAPSQGVWKLTPSSPTSQPSSTGKKVSLLLPGTVAPEPSPGTAPHQPNSSAVKQPGILKTPQTQPTSSGKKSKQPITYDFGAMLEALESKKEQPMTKKEKEAKRLAMKKEEAKMLNTLDSTAPMIKRGKERETPKIKKPSPLKKVILKEREEKKRLRLLDEDEVASGLGMMPTTAFPNSPISAPVGIGVVSGGESDLSQDASFKGSIEVGLGTPASAELSPISQQSPSCMSPMSPGASPLSSGVNSPVTGAIQQTVKLKIHSRRFREYCNQVLDKEIDNHVTALLQDLVRFQDKQFHKDPVKAKAKRRFVLGLREVTKHLKLRKIKCVIISPNLEKIQSKGGLDDALNLILELCNDYSVPFIFALGRRALGRACAKLVPVSVVGIFNYEGSEENFKALVNLTEKARDAYKEMIVQIEKEIAEHPPRTVVPGVPHIYAHMGHSRTPSGCSVISFTSSILSEPISENYPHSEPETDNRGYEIEKEDNLDDVNSEFKDDGKDPYEADDERGYNKTKKGKNAYTGSISDQTTETVDKSNNGKSGTLNSKEIDVNGNEYAEKEITRDKNDQNSDEDDSDNNNEFEEDDDEVDDDDDDDDGDDDEAEKEIDCIDDENESDFESCEEGDKNEGMYSEVGDTIEALPKFIDSVHHFDLTEILSQHSSKTLENGEDVMSTHSSKTTHSSRTLGEGEKSNKKMDMKNIDKSNAVSVKAKAGVDKDLKEHRTRSWVKEAQSFNFNGDDQTSNEIEDSVVEVKNAKMENIDAVV